MARKAVVAMSGGVDSSVAAALLVEQGYEVTGIMLKLWKEGVENSGSGCCSVGAASDARRVADALGIPFYVFNFAERFEQTVMADFNATYAAGRTPNPCVRCNQWVKFDTLLERARQLGAEVLATGHYARVTERNGRRQLRRGLDANKDQSYVLWMLTQEELRHVRFPVGELASKSETRAIAEELGLRTAHKPDSQEICFVRGGDVGDYIEGAGVAGAPGPIVDTSGSVVGEHRGVGRYTVGQRKGLGIALGEPVFVTKIDASSNEITVGPREALAVGGLNTNETRFVDEPIEPGTPILVQHRAHGDVARARVGAASGERLSIEYLEPVEGIAPGQSAAYYSAIEPDLVLGGGIIASTEPWTGARLGSDRLVS